jgi:hypothetical protein
MTNPNTVTDQQPKISQKEFWTPEVLDDITLQVTLHPRAVTWASMMDGGMLKQYAFNSENEYTLPNHLDILAKLEEVLDVVDDNSVLSSSYSQKGKPFSFCATEGRITGLPACIRSALMQTFRDLDVASAQHRVHDIVVKLFLPLLPCPVAEVGAITELGGPEGGWGSPWEPPPS